MSMCHKNLLSSLCRGNPEMKLTEPSQHLHMYTIIVTLLCQLLPVVNIHLFLDSRLDKDCAGTACVFKSLNFGLPKSEKCLSSHHFSLPLLFG